MDAWTQQAHYSLCVRCKAIRYGTPGERCMPLRLRLMLALGCCWGQPPRQSSECARRAARCRAHQSAPRSECCQAARGCPDLQQHGNGCQGACSCPARAQSWKEVSSNLSGRTLSLQRKTWLGCLSIMTPQIKAKRVAAKQSECQDPSRAGCKHGSGPRMSGSRSRSLRAMSAARMSLQEGGPFWQGTGWALLTWLCASFSALLPCSEEGSEPGLLHFVSVVPLGNKSPSA